MSRIEKEGKIVVLGCGEGSKGALGFIVCL